MCIYCNICIPLWGLQWPQWWYYVCWWAWVHLFKFIFTQSYALLMSNDIVTVRASRLSWLKHVSMVLFSWCLELHKLSMCNLSCNQRFKWMDSKLYHSYEIEKVESINISLAFLLSQWDVCGTHIPGIAHLNIFSCVPS